MKQKVSSRKFCGPGALEEKGQHIEWKVLQPNPAQPEKNFYLKVYWIKNNYRMIKQQLVQPQRSISGSKRRKCQTYYNCGKRCHIIQIKPGDCVNIIYKTQRFSFFCTCSQNNSLLESLARAITWSSIPTNSKSLLIQCFKNVPAEKL